MNIEQFCSFNLSSCRTVFLLWFPPSNPFWSLFSLPQHPITYLWTQTPNFIPRLIKLCHISWSRWKKQTPLSCLLQFFGICVIHNWFICIQISIYTGYIKKYIHTHTSYFDENIESRASISPYTIWLDTCLLTLLWLHQFNPPTVLFIDSDFLSTSF